MRASKYSVPHVSGPTQADCHPELAPCGGAAGALERTDPSLRMTIVTAVRRLTAAELAKDPQLRAQDETSCGSFDFARRLASLRMTLHFLIGFETFEIHHLGQIIQSN